MTTLSFEEFRAKLADVVTAAINEPDWWLRKRVRATPDAWNDCCPLGCLPTLRGSPMAFLAAERWNIPTHMAEQFARGFDGKGPLAPKYGADRRPFELGRLYRERFSR